MSCFRIQDPSSDLDYSVNWQAFLDDGGSPSDSIATSTWDIDPDDDGSPGPVLSLESVSGALTSVWVSGLDRGQIYRLTNHIITAQGRSDDRSIIIRCGQT